MSDDLVSRAAAIKAAIEAVDDWDGGYNISRDCIIRDALNKVQTVQTERKKGRWIGGEIGRCSACGHKGCASDIWDGCKEKFCPNCGAELEGEQDG